MENKGRNPSKHNRIICINTQNEHNISNDSLKPKKIVRYLKTCAVESKNRNCPVH